jgi:S1-C subfamily serine protease
MRGGEIDARIELDVRLRRDSEGGLALGPDGQAFGMVVAGARRRVLVIPSATIARVAARLETHGRIARGYLGLALQPVRLDSDGVGAIVMGVDSAGPGAAAGLRQGDVIVSWNGEALRGVRSLLRALGPESVGTTAELALRRGGEPVTAKLKIGERPAA